jgi:hypothetical protein
MNDLKSEGGFHYKISHLSLEKEDSRKGPYEKCSQLEPHTWGSVFLAK